MTGASLNAIGILIGGLFGLASYKPLSPRVQNYFKNALGTLTVFFGLRLVWLGILSNTELHLSAKLKQIVAALLAVTIGSLLGEILCLQKISNYLGRHASKTIASAQSKRTRKARDGFTACAILFCAAPLGLIGAVTDGLSGYFWLLAIKAVMDGLAMVSFVRIFRWPAMLSAIPVFISLSIIAFACRFYVQPFLESYKLVGSVNAVSGFITCAAALVIFEIRKVELANFLPSVAIAPLLGWLFK
ncbi:MAG: DUF554 family protein [Verrucomicrobiota bacterium]